MITNEQLEEIKQKLLGTCQGLHVVLDEMGIEESVDEVEDRLLDGNAVECCMECHWWFESHALEMSDEHNGPVCEDCVPALFNED